jgi:hypothetical protein
LFYIHKLLTKTFDPSETPKELTDKIVSSKKNCLKDSLNVQNFCEKLKDTLDSELIGLWAAMPSIIILKIKLVV